MTPSPSDTARSGIRTAIAGLVINAALAVVKLLTGLVGHSYALVADAVESFADIFASVVVWRGIRVAAQPPDAEHPYGHGKAEALASFIVALMLIGAGVGIAFQAIREIMTPHRTPAVFTLWVLLAVVLAKELLYRFVRGVARRSDSHVLLTDAWHHRSDAITSAAAAIGIGVALYGGPGYEQADDWAALFASGVIVFNAVQLLRPPLAELMDAAPHSLIERVRKIAAAVPGVSGIEKTHARKSGGRYWVDLHMEVDPLMSVRQAHKLAHEVKDTIRTALPSVLDVLIHVEPDKAAAHSNSCTDGNPKANA